MERRELDKQTPGQTDQPGETGSSRQRRQDGHVPARGTRGPGHRRAPGQARVAPAVPPETRAPVKEPVQLNYSFHGNKRRKPNKRSSLQTQEPSKSPGVVGGARAHASDSSGLARARSHVPPATNAARLPCCACSARGSREHREAHAVTRVPPQRVAPAHVGAHECVAQGHGGSGHARGSRGASPFPAQPEQTQLRDFPGTAARLCIGVLHECFIPFTPRSGFEHPQDPVALAGAASGLG